MGRAETPDVEHGLELSGENEIGPVYLLEYVTALEIGISDARCRNQLLQGEMCDF